MQENNQLHTQENVEDIPTIYWHDYETWGSSPQKDRPSQFAGIRTCLLYTSPSPRDRQKSRMPSSA